MTIDQFKAIVGPGYEFDEGGGMVSAGNADWRITWSHRGWAVVDERSYMTGSGPTFLAAVLDLIGATHGVSARALDLLDSAPRPRESGETEE